MGYYGYRTWRGGWSGYQKPTKYDELRRLFGESVAEIKAAFFALEDDALDELFSDYGAIHGEPAEQYARRTFPAWRSRKTGLSGQTMERLISLVPPYLSAEQRKQILRRILDKHKPYPPTYSVKINTEEPDEGFAELDRIVRGCEHEDELAYLPENVMGAAKWLYDSDVTATRAIIAEATRAENEIMKSQARKDLALLRRTIERGQIKTATYSVKLPTGVINVSANAPTKSLWKRLFG